MAEEKSHKRHHAEHKKSLSVKKTNLWGYATALAVLLLVISIFTGGFGINKSAVAGAISAEEAAEKAIDYINNNLVQTGEATLDSVKEVNGIYEVTTSYQGQKPVVYITKDGVSLFLSQPVDTTEEIEIPTVQPAQQDIPKSDKPEVELFVMSYCPYGTQAEKGIIPAVRALGGNIDFKVRFVYYAMHGEKEVTEQTRQYCIQEEQNDKLLDYLACFLGDGESEPCLTEANIDTAKLDLCVEAADSEFEITANLEDEEKWLNGRYPKFNTDADLNSEYGVSGSPTLVINGNKVSSSRDSASYLATICSAFNEAPEACSEELSSATPSAGFGYSEGVATDAQC